MTRPCVSLEEIPEILREPDGSPGRRHIEECPRCGAVAMAYREFLEDGSIPRGADMRDAESRLRAAFLALPSVSPISAHSAHDEGGTIQPAERKGRQWPSRWSRGFRGARVLAPAIAVLAIGLYVGVRTLDREPGPDRLRGAGPVVPGREVQTIALLEARAWGADDVELRWRAVSTASTYEVVLFGTDLTDLAHLTQIADTVLVVRRRDLHPEPSAGTLVGWQVIARRDGAIVARSPIAATKLP